MKKGTLASTKSRFGQRRIAGLLPLLILAITLASWLLQALSPLHARPWENKDGATLEGELLGIENGEAVIQRKGDFRMFRIAVTTLSLADQQLIKQMQDESKIGPGLRVPLPDALKRSLKGHYAFEIKEDLGDDSSGSRSPLGSNEVKMDSSEDGLLNGAASFNGRNSIFFMRHIMPLKNQPLSFSCWIKTGSNEEQEIFACGGDSHGFSLYTSNRTVGYLYRWAKGGKNFSEVRFSNRPVMDGEWHHLCAVTDEKGTSWLWVDGQPAGNRQGELTRNEPKYGSILGSVPNGRPNVRRSRETRPFNGLIDEVMVFDRPLTEVEVNALYRSHQPFAQE